MPKVCVMTDVHWIFDNRISKEINTLVKAGYEVYYVVPADEDEVKKYIDSHPQVHVMPIHRYENRRRRMQLGVKEAYKAALTVDADVYHFHDPELIRAGIWLKLRGKKVIYDVHENYVSVFLLRRKRSHFFKYLVVTAYWIFEKIANLMFDGIIVVNEEVRKKFNKSKSIVVPNYPELSIFEKIKRTKHEDKEITEFVYLGSISIQRGIREMIRAAEIASKSCRLKLIVIGNAIDSESEKYLNENRSFFEYVPRKPYIEALKIANSADGGFDNSTSD